MAINLPRYADDDAVDLVNGAYNQAMDEIESNLDSAWDNIGIAKTKANAASATAEQAKTSVLEQKGEIDKLRGDVDGLIAGGGEATVPIATTEKAGIVKPDGSTISVQVDGTVSLADNSVNSTKLAAGGVTEDKLSDGVKAKLNKPAIEPYTLPVATYETLGGVKSGRDMYIDENGRMIVGRGMIAESQLSTEVQAKLNKTAPAYSLPVATTTVLGGVKSGGDINVGSTGTMTVGSAAVTTTKISDAAVTETKLSTDVQAKLNKSSGLTEVPDNSVTSAKIVNGAVTETKLSTDVQAKLNKSTGLTEVPDNSVTSAKIVNGAVTETKLSADVQAKLNKPAGEPYTLPIATKTVLGGVKLGPQFLSTDDGAIALGNESIYTSSYVDNSVTEAKLSTDVQNKLNRSAPAYSLPVASTSRLGGVKAGRDIDIDSSGLMTIGSGMIEESQLSSSVRNKLNKSSETISAQSININTTSYAGTNCHGFKFGDLVILNIQARNLSGNSGIKIGSVAYAYTPREEMSGPCVCGNGLGQFVIRTSGDIIINPKGNGADGFFTCTYVL